MKFKIGDRVRIKDEPETIWEIIEITELNCGELFVKMWEVRNKVNYFSQPIKEDALKYAYADDRAHKALGTLLEAYYGHLECDFNWDAIRQGNIDADIAADIISYARSLIRVAEAVQTLEQAQGILESEEEAYG